MFIYAAVYSEKDILWLLKLRLSHLSHFLC